MSQRDDDAGPSPISGAWIYRLLDDHVLTSVWKRPSPKACDDLAGSIEFVRLACEPEQDPVATHFAQLAAQTAAALDTLADTLPRQRTNVAKAGAPGPLAALDDLARAVAAARENYLWAVAYPERKPRSKRWHDVVVTLSNDFCAAMASSNPGREIGRANHDTILARYLVEIIPHVTGECVKAPAVMVELSRQSKANRDTAEWLAQNSAHDNDG